MVNGNPVTPLLPLQRPRMREAVQQRLNSPKAAPQLVAGPVAHGDELP